MRNEERKKKSILKQWWFWTVLVCVILIFVTLVLLIFSFSNKNISQKNVEFKVGKFDLDTDEASYGTTYKGECTIKCEDEDNDYLVFVEIEDKNNNSDPYTSIVLVHDGRGECTTYDSSVGNKVINKPDYKIRVLSYTKFTNIKK